MGVNHGIEAVEVGKGRKNRSPKGNKWSAIPVALICMIVNWGDGKQGGAFKGN